jgi:glutamate synthase (NADPH/NADH) small chain
MANTSKEKVKMPEQAADVRNKNFLEVALGYDADMAVEEAGRCLNCKKQPCVAGCPVNVRIPEFIGLVAEQNFDEAYRVLKDTNSLPAICGRVCPQESQCEKFCLRGNKGEPVAIGRLERFLADRQIQIDEAQADGSARSSKVTGSASGGKKVAVIGSGPASLTCAGDLAKQGFDVTVFEAFHVSGGVLMYGIPEFRLPKKLVQQEIAQLTDLGVKIVLDTVVGKTTDISDLRAEGYEAVFIGTGAGLPTFMKIPGENLCGVYSANEFLTRINLMKGYRFPETDTPVKRGGNVAVFGGGNVAMDAARCAKRLGAENVYIVYRRSEKEMPARVEEVHHAAEEGIIFQMLTNPTQILDDGNGWVRGVECLKMELGEPDASGRRRPVPMKGSEYVIEVNTVVVAIGQSPNPIIRNSMPELKTESWGGIIVDEATGATNIAGIYAGGDAVTGAATVILAMGAGKSAAEAITKYLAGQ